MTKYLPALLGLCLSAPALAVDSRDMHQSISINYGVVSKLTSFVAVEERDKKEEFGGRLEQQLKKVLQEEAVDSLSYLGWQDEEDKDKDLVRWQ